MFPLITFPSIFEEFKTVETTGKNLDTYARVVYGSYLERERGGSRILFYLLEDVLRSSPMKF